MGFYLNLEQDKRPRRPPPNKPPAQAKRVDKSGAVRDRVQQRGYAKLRSETLGIDIYWARDERVAKQLPRGAVVFTLDELEGLRGITKEELKEYTIKKVFNAREVGLSAMEGVF